MISEEPEESDSSSGELSSGEESHSGGDSDADPSYRPEERLSSGGSSADIAARIRRARGNIIV